MNELTIKIYESVDEPGYFYDIYEGRKELDGGHCTTTIENALDMAHFDAHRVLAQNRQKNY